MNKEPSVLPCPWCGGTEVIRQQVDTEDREGIPYCAVCAECGASSPMEYVSPKTSESIIDAIVRQLWNNRQNND